MTARCVRVVQNVPFFPPRTNLEKDVAPSVLSSGGALNITHCLSADVFCKSFVVHSWHWAIAAPANIWLFDYHLGEPPNYPQNPHGQVRISSLPLESHWPKGRFTAPWNPRYNIKTNRAPIGCRECFAPKRHGWCECRYCRSVWLPITTTVSPVDDDQGNVLGCGIIKNLKLNLLFLSST